MAVCSLGFLFFCGAAVIVFHLAPGKWLRQVILAGTSALFLAPLVPDLRSWEWFATVLAGTYLALVVVRARPRGAYVAIAATLVLVLYLYLKRYTLLADFIPFPLAWDLRLHPVELVGLSYMLFKFLHMLVDQWQGQLAPFNLWTYLNYQLSFFTITAGPIQRYNDFLRYWEEMDLQPSETRESLLYWIRILTGMIKVGVLGAYAEWAFNAANRAHLVPTLSEAMVCLYAYPVYLYFNFSGYTDIVLGAGGLLGFRLPENFNRPWLSRNVLDFWDRWHITLTHWIRDYIFMASYKVAATKFPGGARYWSYALLFFALFVAGVWHGTTDGFVMFGALNGLGAAATRAYGDVLRATLGRQRLHAYLKNPTVRLIAIVVTLHYVCVCQLFFATDLDRALQVLGGAASGLVHLPGALLHYSWEGPAVVLVAAAVVLTLLWKSDLAGSFVQRIALRIGQRNGWLSAILCVECAFVAGMFFVDWAFQQEPPPVLYMAF
ncbi:MAG TPA: MBOAT family O-acyltransferase [Planctomycetaceae bacterium]|nr:MBOAT family O-acyltransferase [Planctomycetaceae bacterium]